jgi:hypothetical protein
MKSGKELSGITAIKGPDILIKPTLSQQVDDVLFVLVF